MRVVTQVALTGIRVVTQDFGRKSKLNFFVVTQVYVKPVATRGSTVYGKEAALGLCEGSTAAPQLDVTKHGIKTTLTHPQG
jgi:hypothetical protein